MVDRLRSVLHTANPHCSIGSNDNIGGFALVRAATHRILRRVVVILPCYSSLNSIDGLATDRPQVVPMNNGVDMGSTVYRIAQIAITILKDIAKIKLSRGKHRVLYPKHITIVILHISRSTCSWTTSRVDIMQLIAILVNGCTLFTVWTHEIARRVDILGHTHAGESHHRHDK